jgi:hypothetical protein
MPNNPKKKAGDSGKAAADMMAGLMEYLAMASPQATQAMPIPVPVQAPEFDNTFRGNPYLSDLLDSEHSYFSSVMDQLDAVPISTAPVGTFSALYEKLSPSYQYYIENAPWLYDMSADQRMQRLSDRIEAPKNIRKK